MYFITMKPTVEVETQQLRDPNLEHLSGDVSDSMDTLELTLATLKRKQRGSVWRQSWVEKYISGWWFGTSILFSHILILGC